MWDWLDSAATTVGNLFSSDSGTSAADAFASTADQTGAAVSDTSWGNLDLSAFDQAAGGTSGSGYDAASAGSGLNIGWNTLGSALKATSGLMGTPKSGIGSGFVTKTTELPGQNRAMGYDPTKNPAQTGAMPSVDPRQTNSWWYNMMKTFAYAGK
jgi:hypothetical protein